MNKLLRLVFVVALLLQTPNVWSADKLPLVENFVLEIFENGKTLGRFLLVQIIFSEQKPQWTTVFMASPRCIGEHNLSYATSRWDEVIYDLKYDDKSFSLKMKFPFANEEHLVSGSRNRDSGRLKVEGVGFRDDMGHIGKRVKIEWKSVD